MKEVFVKDIKEGDMFDSIFLLEDVTQRETKKLKPYWILKLTDKTGTIAAKVWEADAWADPVLIPKRGDYIKVRVEAGSYKGEVDLSIKIARKVDPEKETDIFNYEDFVPVGPLDRFALMNQLEDWARHIDHPGLRRVTTHLFTDPELHMALRDCPAASAVHQAYIGGLVEHILNLLNLANFVCEYYKLKQESKDLLYAACFLHDIGKIRELKWSKGIGYTDEGILIGHVGIGMEMLDRMRTEYWTGVEAALRPTEGDDWQKQYDHHADLWMHLRHLIASHHGNLEWRAISVPQSREANLFHLIDMIDAKMGQFNVIDQTDVDEDGFTSYNNKLGSRAWRMK